MSFPLKAGGICEPESVLYYGNATAYRLSLVFWMLTGSPKKQVRHTFYQEVFLFPVDTNIILNRTGQTSNIPHKWIMNQTQ